MRADACLQHHNHMMSFVLTLIIWATAFHAQLVHSRDGNMIAIVAKVQCIVLPYWKSVTLHAQEGGLHKEP